MFIKPNVHRFGKAINIPPLRSEDFSNGLLDSVCVGTLCASQVTPTFLSSRLGASTNVSRVRVAYDLWTCKNYQLYKRARRL